MRFHRSAAGALGIALAVGLVAGCSSEAEPLADAASTATATQSPEATPLLTTTSTPTPTAARRTPSPSATSSPSALPTDDENGELAGQLIIEYPGKPLRRTNSTTPNSEVRDVQVRLVEVGFPVAANGVFDAKTERVVKSFQRSKGLKVDGIVGANTWAALFTFGA